MARIVADVVDQPGALPLLQYALTELFDRNVSGLMTMAAYDELGGMSGALARRAEQVHSDLSTPEQDVARRVFTRLVTLGEGTEDTRRRVRRAEFAGVVDGSGSGRQSTAWVRVVDSRRERRHGSGDRRVGMARLLAFDRDPATREPHHWGCCLLSGKVRPAHRTAGH